jgi:hypothetical protein
VGDDIKHVLDVLGPTGDMDGYGPGWFDLEYSGGLTITIEESGRVYEIQRNGRNYASTQP